MLDGRRPTTCRDWVLSLASIAAVFAICCIPACGGNRLGIDKAPAEAEAKAVGEPSGGDGPGPSARGGRAIPDAAAGPRESP